MSQPSTISKPPPSAKPLTRAITGTFSVSRSAMPPKPPGRAAAQYSTPLIAGFFRSAPAQKARSPAPVSTTTRTSSSRFDRGPDALQLGLGREVDRVHHLRPIDGDAWRRGRAPRRRTLIDAHSPRRARARLGQHLVGVLAQPRRRAAQAGLRARHPDRAGDEAQRTSGASPPSMIISLCSVCGSTSASRMSRTGAHSRSCSSSRASQCSRVLLAKRSRNIACSSALCSNCASSVGEARVAATGRRSRARCRCRAADSP